VRPTCWEEEAAGRKEERADALGSELGEPSVVARAAVPVEVAVDFVAVAAAEGFAACRTMPFGET